MIGTALQTGRSDAGFVGEFLTDFGIPPGLASAIGSAAVFVVVFVGLYIVGKGIVVPFVDDVLKRRDIDDHARKPLRILVHVAVVAAGFGLGFALAGYGNILLALSTVGAAATLAVGFALQDVIKNFVAGVFIYTDQPFRTGDWIEWGGNSGFVEDIGLRVTRVRTFDNEHLTVPNAQLTDDVIKNYDRNRTLRLKFTFRIGFEDDIDDAMDHIVAAAEAEEEILEEPEPSVKLMEINEASFDLQGRIWIRDPGDSDFLGIRGRFVKDVTDRFEAAGISIPYPHRTVEGSLDTSVRGPSGVVSDD
ncbi:mechanosensitive ion channel family protein [Haloplanus rubicundus]|uniref:Mechanosensitive ion channel family protein n=1 Tax=Haloplanus rubicundus TaxID=1547898 RepID=A0A345E6P2_9EURY|nr:mechanosensitive ion channel family protein [Haloplanus rubicundus]AXG07864.1 mechanosensitive ion channel family protein [Haloplanus rubicundus]